MADGITVLQHKRQQLSNLRQEIQKEFNERLQEVDQKIADVDNAIHLINESIKDYVCPKCHGSGEVFRLDAAGSREKVKCPVCVGTGAK